MTMANRKLPNWPRQTAATAAAAAIRKAFCGGAGVAEDMVGVFDTEKDWEEFCAVISAEGGALNR